MKADIYVIKLQKGDKNAFRPIVETYQAEIRTLIACNGINLTDVDDIAQATFLYVYQHVDRYQPGTNFRAWLHTITMYKTKAFLEEKKREAAQAALDRMVKVHTAKVQAKYGKDIMLMDEPTRKRYEAEMESVYNTPRYLELDQIASPATYSGAKYLGPVKG